MYNLYTIAKKKTGILGLWKDKNKIYRDKIKIENCENPKVLNEKINFLFSQGEKACFYTAKNEAFIEYKEGKLDFLRHRIAWNENKLRPSLVKELLKQNGGLTIFKNENGYTIEIWKE